VTSELAISRSESGGNNGRAEFLIRKTVVFIFNLSSFVLVFRGFPATSLRSPVALHPVSNTLVISEMSETPRWFACIYLSVATALASDKIAAIATIPKARNSIK